MLLLLEEIELPSTQVMSLHHKADERAVYGYFSKNCGKVRDVQLIRDPQSGRSKGIAYIEFYLPESVFKVRRPFSSAFSRASAISRNTPESAQCRSKLKCRNRLP